METSHKKLVQEHLKPDLLLAFVLAGLILIILIWPESLTEGSGKTPGYVRFTPRVESQTMGGTPVPPEEERHAESGDGQSLDTVNPADSPDISGTAALPTDPEPTMSLMDQ